MPCPSELQNYKFQVSRTNGSRVIENGRGNTFELCHVLLSHKTTNEIKLPIYILNFKCLGQKTSSKTWKGKQHDNNTTTTQQWLDWEAALLPEWQCSLKSSDKKKVWQKNYPKPRSRDNNLGSSINDVLFFGPIFDLPTYPVRFFHNINLQFYYMVSYFGKTTNLPQNQASFMDVPLLPKKFASNITISLRDKMILGFLNKGFLKKKTVIWKFG